MKHMAGVSNTLVRVSVSHSKHRLLASRLERKGYHATPHSSKPSLEPRLEDHGRVIHDEYSIVRDHYGLLSVSITFQTSANPVNQTRQNTRWFSLMACLDSMNCELVAGIFPVFSIGVASKRLSKHEASK
jgi:hypothetical protein